MTEFAVEHNDMVATVTISFPKAKNAIESEGWSTLQGILDDLANDDSVRCVVISGEGDDFCSGAYVGPGRDRGNDSHGLLAMRRVGQCCNTLFNLPKPTIARVNGVAAGAGMNLALACDFVLASDRSRFSEIFARRGLNIDFGGSFILPRIVGLQKAKELVMLAEVIDAAYADELGLVTRVVPEAELDALVAEFAGKLASGPPVALAASKKLLNQSFTSTLDEALESEGFAQTVQFATDDVKEAGAAFIEKRQPKFSGR